MAVDLKSITSMRRFSLLLMDDCLLKLEHERTQDRIRRFSYETIQSVIIWQKVPWVRIVICIVLLVFPGFALFLADSTPSTIAAIFLIALGGSLTAWYSYCKVTTIRIVRGGTNTDLKGLFRPGRLRRFRERFLAAIRAGQPADIQLERAADALGFK